jgi:hypothetical protein
MWKYDLTHSEEERRQETRCTAHTARQVTDIITDTFRNIVAVAKIPD